MSGRAVPGAPVDDGVAGSPQVRGGGGRATPSPWGNRQPAQAPSLYNQPQTDAGYTAPPPIDPRWTQEYTRRNSWTNRLGPNPVWGHTVAPSGPSQLGPGAGAPRPVYPRNEKIGQAYGGTPIGQPVNNPAATWMDSYKDGMGNGGYGSYQRGMMMPETKPTRPWDENAWRQSFQDAVRQNPNWGRQEPVQMYDDPRQNGWRPASSVFGTFDQGGYQGIPENAGYNNPVFGINPPRGGSSVGGK